VTFIVRIRGVSKVFTLILILATSALSDVNGVDLSRAVHVNARNVLDEPDPIDIQGCSSLGELDIAFRTDNNGSPNVGVVLIDPRGRRFGFDPLDKRAWDELPVAQGYIDCDVLDDSDACQGVVQICGPISGTYKLEVIAQRTTAYSLSILGRSKGTHDTHGPQFSQSDAHVNDVDIRGGSRDVVLVDYSRDPQEMVAARSQLSQHAQR
jgi:hypothetical protein